MRRLLFLSIAIGLAGCSSKPTRDECEKAINLAGRVLYPPPDPNAPMPQGIVDFQKAQPALVKACVEKSSRAQVACMSHARTKDDVYACLGENQGGEAEQ